MKQLLKKISLIQLKVTNKIVGIYAIINVLSQKLYIGSSNDMYKRFKQHKRALIKNKHNNYKLQRAWNKYGSEVFEFQILETVSENLLLNREDYWLNYKQSYSSQHGYNINKKANAPSVAMILKIWNEKYGAEEACRREKKWRQLHKNAITGKSVNRGNIRKDLSNYNIKIKSKPILQYDLNKILIKEWNSIREAGRGLNINPTGISRACRGILKTSNNFVWKYKKLKK